MRTYKIKLGGEDFELLGSFDNWLKVEGIVGKIYSMAGKISVNDMGLCDVVQIYHQMQSGSAKNKQEILDGVCVEGLSDNLEKLIEILEEIVTGNKKGKSEKK